MKYLPLLLLTLIASMMVGCRRNTPITSVGVKPPQIAVQDVYIVSQTDQGASFEVVVKLTNVSDVVLPLKQTKYSLTVGKTTMGPYSGWASRTLPSSGTQMVTLKASGPITDAIEGAAYRVSGTIAYQPPGEMRQILTESNVPLPTVSFSGTGEVRPAN